MKRIAVDLAKSVYQVAESVRAGVVESSTVGRGESCSGTRPITMLILEIA